jgi:tetratricopeptide (TPR) repeat protein
MTDPTPVLKLEPVPSSEEQEQLRQTIEMFEVITQANPQDTQSLEILKEAHAKIGANKEALVVSRRLADAYMDLGQYSSALLEYEGILQKDPDNAEVIAALGEVEARLQAVQSASAGNAAAIALDFRAVVQEGGNLITTKKTQTTDRVSMSGAMDSAAVAARLEGSEDGNDALVRFLIQHRLASADVVNQAITIVRKRNKDRQPTQVASSLIDEIVTRGQVELEQLLCGILDRSKFAYIPLEHYDIDRQIVKMLPESLTLGRLIVPFDILSRTMMIAVANPFDAAGKEAVQQLLDYNIQWHLASPASILKVLADAYKL